MPARAEAMQKRSETTPSGCSSSASSLPKDSSSCDRARVHPRHGPCQRKRLTVSSLFHIGRHCSYAPTMSRVVRQAPARQRPASATVRCRSIASRMSCPPMSSNASNHAVSVGDEAAGSTRRRDGMRWSGALQACRALNIPFSCRGERTECPNKAK